MQLKNKNSITLYHKSVIMQEVSKMIDPCKSCHRYPKNCHEMCTDKRQYCGEVDREIPTIRMMYRRIAINEYNKNGIRRS